MPLLNFTATSPRPLTDYVDFSYPSIIEGVKVTTGVLPCGSVLGKINTSVGTPSEADSNVGDGTVGTISLGSLACGGVYRLECITLTPSVLFKLISPVGQVVSSTIAVGTNQTTSHLLFRITAGTIPFALGDTLLIPVLAENYKLSEAAATDGSAVPSAVLLKDIDASSGMVDTIVLLSGKINVNLLNFGTGHSAGTIVEPFRLRNIHLTNYTNNT